MDDGYVLKQDIVNAVNELFLKLDTAYPDWRKRRETPEDWTERLQKFYSADVIAGGLQLCFKDFNRMTSPTLAEFCQYCCQVSKDQVVEKTPLASQVGKADQKIAFLVDKMSKRLSVKRRLTS